MWGAELEVLKGAAGILSKSKDLALFVEVHSDDLVRPLLELCGSYGFKVKFEKIYENGSSHHLLKKKQGSSERKPRSQREKVQSAVRSLIDFSKVRLDSYKSVRATT